MAKERVKTFYNAGDETAPDWQIYFGITVADAVMMSDGDAEEKTIVDYVKEKIAELIGGAPETYDTLKEFADYIAEHEDVANALNAAIAAKADKTVATTNADGIMSKEDKRKLDSISEGANNYSHPQTHPASMIQTDNTHNFVTNNEKTTWNGKATIGLGTAYPSAAPNNSLFFLIKK